MCVYMGNLISRTLNKCHLSEPGTLVRKNKSSSGAQTCPTALPEHSIIYFHKMKEKKKQQHLFYKDAVLQVYNEKEKCSLTLELHL